MKIKEFFMTLRLLLSLVLLEICLLALSMKAMGYLYLGALMLLTSTVLAFIFFGWKLALIVFLAVQGNEIVQRTDFKLYRKETYLNDGVTRCD